MEGGKECSCDSEAQENGVVKKRGMEDELILAIDLNPFAAMALDKNLGNFFTVAF